MASSFLAMTRDGRLGAAALKSLARLGQGYTLSVVVGLPLGLALARPASLLGSPPATPHGSAERAHRGPP